MEKITRRSRKIMIGLAGGIVLIVGIIMIPYPGPGWLVVFAGLAILAQEFTWAQRILDYAKGKYDGWQAWLKKQHWALKALFIILTGLVVMVTLWLINAYGLIDNWLHLGQDWAHSPLFK